MKNLFPFPIAFFTGLILLTGSGCEQNRTTETRTVATNDSTVVISKRSAERDLKEFRDWVKNRTGKADSNLKENWPEIKEDFKKRSAQLETRLDSLSEDSKREYADLQKRYKVWENVTKSRTSQPLTETGLTAWRKQLLGDRSNYTAITGANAKETYLLFMGIVRAKNAGWSPEDWDYADHIYGELNNRKKAIESTIPGADRLKIKTLQAEYLALEAKNDAQDAYKYMKKKE